MAKEGPRKKRRWKRRLVIALLLFPPLLVALVLLVAAFLPLIVTEDRVRSELVSALTETLGVPVKIGRVKYGTFSGIELFDVTVGPPPGFTRDVLEAKRVAVRYAIEPFRRELEIKEIAVDDPRAVIEKKGEETNVDAILKHLASGKPEKPKPEASKEPRKPLKGSLSPVTLAVDVVAIRNLSFETVGDGPHLSLQGVNLQAGATLDSKRAGAKLVLSVREAPQGPNIVLDVPGEAPLHAEVRAAFTTTVAADADAHDGVSVERARVDIGLDAAADARYGERRPPHTTVALRLGVEARPTEDWAAVEGASLVLDGTNLVSAGVRIDGVFALIAGFLGEAATEALGAQFGLAKKSKDGVVKIALQEIAVPLTVLRPYIEMFRPDVRVHGKLALSPILIEGTADELVKGLPRKLEVGLLFDDVRADVTSAGLSLSKLSGRIALEKGTSDPFSISGTLDIDRVVQKANEIGSAKIGVDVGLERLAYPVPGHLHAALDVALTKVRAPPARIDRARVLAEVAGDDVLAPDRSDADPIEVHARVETDHLGVGSATAAIAIDKLALDVKAALDRALLPAKKPIHAKIALGADRVNMEGRGMRVRGALVDLDAQLTDPRRALPLDANAKLLVRAKEASTPEASLENAKIELKADLAALTERRISAIAPKPTMLPASVDLDLDVDLPKIGVVHKKLGVFDTKVELSTRAGVSLVNGTANLGALSISLADAVKLKASGRAKEIFEKRPWFDARVEVPPVDLAKLVHALPPGVLASVPGLAAQGTVGLSVKAVGMPPAAGAIDLEDPPITAELKLALKGVGADVPSAKLAFQGFDGELAAGVGKARSQIGARLSLERLTRGDKSAKAELQAISVKLDAGLLDEVWQLAGDITAARLESGLGSRSAVQGANVSLDAIYPKRGDLEIRHLDVKLPDSGADIAIKGRLARRAFGVLRPDLSISALLDFDRLRTLVPEIGDAHGRLAAVFGLKSETETLLDASGKVELDEFSYKAPGLELVHASGRIPVDQKIALPPAQLRESVASFVGATGDDLEARITELSGDLSALKVVLANEDILVAPPRTADYVALRPYYVMTGSDLKIEQLTYGAQKLKDLTFEGDWKSGIFRIDRVSAAIWEGDVLGDLALQITADRNLRIRARLTLTELNLDIPYSLAKKISTAAGSEREDYKISGTADIQFALRQKAIDGRVDLVKLKKPSVERLLGLLDPSGVAQGAMAQSEQAGVVPVALHIWITRNLLSLSLDWKLVYFKVSFDSWMDALLSIPGSRFLVTPTLGAFVMDTVNNSVRGVSIGNFLEANINDAMVERAFGFMAGKVVAEEARDNARPAGPASKVSER